MASQGNPVKYQPRTHSKTAHAPGKRAGRGWRRSSRSRPRQDRRARDTARAARTGETSRAPRAVPASHRRCAGSRTPTTRLRGSSRDPRRNRPESVRNVSLPARTDRKAARASGRAGERGRTARSRAPRAPRARRRWQDRGPDGSATSRSRRKPPNLWTGPRWAPPATVQASFTRSTRSTCRRRLSARSTRKLNSSITICSPRLGTWPKRLMTSPPTVSKSSSL